MSKNNWGQEITALINKKGEEIEDPLRRFKYFKLLAQAAKGEARRNLEPFLPNDTRAYSTYANMEIPMLEILDYTEETNDEKK
jgi:hypothetical protein